MNATRSHVFHRVLTADEVAANAAIYRLSSSGKRLGEVPATYDPTTGFLSFTARTDYDPFTATYLYEIVRDYVTRLWQQFSF